MPWTHNNQQFLEREALCTSRTISVRRQFYSSQNTKMRLRLTKMMNLTLKPRSHAMPNNTKRIDSSLIVVLIPRRPKSSVLPSSEHPKNTHFGTPSSECDHNSTTNLKMRNPPHRSLDTPMNILNSSLGVTIDNICESR